jgi:hypothetical protein
VVVDSELVAEQAVMVAHEEIVDVVALPDASISTLNVTTQSVTVAFEHEEVLDDVGVDVGSSDSGS